MSRAAMVSKYLKRAAFLNCVILAGCQAPHEGISVLTAEMPLHEKHPDLVAHYQEFLETQWEAHQLLAGQFSA